MNIHFLWISFCVVKTLCRCVVSRPCNNSSQWKPDVSENSLIRPNGTIMSKIEELLQFQIATSVEFQAAK
jgi:hypothetical protein